MWRCCLLLLLAAAACRVAAAPVFPAFIVSLPDALERRACTLRLFDGILNATFVDSVRGKDASHLLVGAGVSLPHSSYGEWFFGLDKMSARYAGELGCTLGHLTAIRRAYESGAQHALIMEDDTSPALLRFWQDDVLSSFVAWLPARWGVAQLSLTSDGPQWDALHSEWARSGRPRAVARNSAPHFWSATAYLINRSAMRRLVHKFWVAVHPACGIQCGRWNLSSAPSMAFDVGVLSAATEPSHYFLATPPLFTPVRSVRSQIQQEDVTLFSFAESINTKNTLTLSTGLALAWNAEAFIARTEKASTRSPPVSA